MANWASTSYAIEGSKSDLEKVFNAIDAFVKGKMKPVAENAANDWEGNVLVALGATKEQVEEAWGATDFRHVLGKLMPDLTIYYIVEEAGCEVFATNDTDGKYYPERYLVDAYVKDADYYEFFETEKQMKSFVSSLLEKEDFTEEDIEAWNEEHEDDGSHINVHEFKYVA